MIDSSVQLAAEEEEELNFDLQSSISFDENLQDMATSAWINTTLYNACTIHR